MIATFSNLRRQPLTALRAAATLLAGLALSLGSARAAPSRSRFVPQLGITPETSLQQAGFQVRSATGALSISDQPTSITHMVVGHGRTAVLMMAGGPITSLELGLARPARKIFLERIGTSHGASIPTWRIEALDKSGRVLDSVGEEHGLPANARMVELHGQYIAAVRLSTDNRSGTGTWATWSCLPISELSWEEFEGSPTPEQSASPQRATPVLRKAAELPKPRTNSELPIPGAVWRGRSWDGWDFVLSEPAISDDGTIRYRYAATREAGDHPGTGVVDVTFFGRHMKATLTTSPASTRGVIDATFIPDGRYAYAVGTIANGTSRAAWWATLDASATVAVPERVDLNTVSVSELEAAGFSARSARSVVEGRIFWGRYRSVNEALAAPGLSSRDRSWLQSKSYVR